MAAKDEAMENFGVSEMYMGVWGPALKAVPRMGMKILPDHGGTL